MIVIIPCPSTTEGIVNSWAIQNEATIIGIAASKKACQACIDAIVDLDAVELMSRPIQPGLADVGRTKKQIREDDEMKRYPITCAWAQYPE